MALCVIRVLGDNFDPAAFLETVTINPTSIFRRGEVRAGRRRASQTSGFTCELAAGAFESQIDAAIAWLKSHCDELKLISATPAVESAFVDFMYDCRLNEEDNLIQRDFFPPELIQLAGKAGIGICISLSKPIDAEESK